MLKRVVSSLTLAAFVSISIAPVQASTHWANEEISKWSSVGYYNYQQSPDSVITRGEFVQLCNKFSISGIRSDKVFTDISDSSAWHSDVALAVEQGYIGGFPNGTFNPSGALTRSEMASIICRMKHLPENPSASYRFRDDIPTWSAGAIGAVVTVGIMNGYPDGTFHPNDTLTKAEALATLDRAFSNKVIQKSDIKVDSSQNHINKIIDGDIRITKKSDIELVNTDVLGNIIVDADDVELTLTNSRARNIILEEDSELYLDDSFVQTINVNDGDNELEILGSVNRINIDTSNTKIVNKPRSYIGEITEKSNVRNTSVKNSGNIKSGEYKGNKNSIKDLDVTNITIDPNTIIVSPGSYEQADIKSTPKGLDNEDVIWESEDDDIFTVDDKGKVRGREEGTAYLYARVPGKDIEAKVKVKVEEIELDGIELDESNISIYVGQSYDLDYDFEPYNYSGSVTWESSDESVAEVDKYGEVEGISPGKAEITVKVKGENKSDRCTVTVTKKNALKSMKFPRPDYDMNAGDTMTLTPTTYPSNADLGRLHWTSSNQSIATVNPRGEITALSEGFTLIRAEEIESKISAECYIYVTGTSTPTPPPDSGDGDGDNNGNTATENITLEKGQKHDLSSYGMSYWYSEDENIATVLNNQIIANGIGQVNIIGKHGNKSIMITLDVVQGIEDISLNVSNVNVEHSTSLPLIVTALPMAEEMNNYKATTDNNNVAIVNNGKIVATGVGTCKLVISLEDGRYSKTIDVKVNPSLVKGVSFDKTDYYIPLGEVDTIIPTLNPLNPTNKNMSFTISNDNILLRDGLLEGKKIGSSILTVKTEDGGHTASTKVHVYKPAESIILEESTVYMKSNSNKAIMSTVLPESATYKTLQYTSSNPAIASVNSAGMISSLVEGESTITIKEPISNVSTTIKVIVLPSNVPITEKEITKSGEVCTLNSSLNWTSEHPSVIKIENGKAVASNANMTTPKKIKLTGKDKNGALKEVINISYNQPITLSNKLLTSEYAVTALGNQNLSNVLIANYTGNKDYSAPTFTSSNPTIANVISINTLFTEDRVFISLVVDVKANGECTLTSSEGEVKLRVTNGAIIEENKSVEKIVKEINSNKLENVYTACDEISKSKQTIDSKKSQLKTIETALMQSTTQERLSIAYHVQLLIIDLDNKDEKEHRELVNIYNLLKM